MTAAANQAAVTSFLAGKGLSPAAIAGIEGNLKVESGFNPANNSGDKGTSWGLAQWHLGRRDALVKYAGARGKSWTDLPTQLDYLWAELNGPYKSTLTALNAPGITPEAAAAVFDKKFEGSDGSARATREKYARQIFGGLGSTSSSSSSPTLVSSSVTTAGLLDGASSGGGAAVKDLLSGKPVAAAADVTVNPATNAAGKFLAYGLGAVLAGTLVVLGLYKAFSPTIKNVSGHVEDKAGSAAKLAALL